ncbi:universal stress protein [Streptomyces sp. NPDC006450]|uniref:universal stress protein n=1 Tax=Streptomyces sp. NPDC006450 TaxID=3155458 RepID=UPI0033A330AE
MLENPPLPVSTTEERRHWAEGVLRDTADEQRRGHPSLEIASRRVGGLPSLALAAAAKDSALLAIGSRGLGSVAGFLVGSTGSTTVSATECPVVLVRAPGHALPAAEAPARRGPVVAGVDIGRPCDRLLSFAFEEAALHGCPLVVVHGWSPPPVLGYAPAFDAGVHAEMARGVATALDEMLHPWRARFPSVTVDPRATIGSAAVRILDAAVGATLVVVGRRIRRAEYGTHVGAIAHAVMHHSASPIAVVAHD